MPRRVAVCAFAAVALVATACGGGGGAGTALVNTSSSTSFVSGTTAPFAGFGQAAGVRCLPAPKDEGRRLDWLPSDLPLPNGFIVLSDAPATGGYHRGTVAIPLAMRDLITFVLTEWPKHGWRMGRGDAENGEAEDTFVRGTDGGGFRARSTYCRPTWSEFYLVLKIPGAAADTGGTVPGQRPLQSGAGSPLVSSTTR